MKAFAPILFEIVLFQLSINLLDAQWTKTAGPFGGDVLSIASNANYRFAGTSNGVYRSVLGANVWQLGDETLLGNRVNALAADSANVYSGTDHGLFISSDDGNNWTLSNLSGRIITALAVKDSILFAGAGDGVFASSDKGVSWGQIDSGLAAKNVLTFATHAGLVFVSTLYDGLYRSSDNGVNWTKTSLVEDAVFALMSLGNELLASSWDNVVYRSTDNGDTWMSSDIGDIYTAVTCFGANPQKVFAATNDGIYYSLDSAKNWQPSSLRQVYVRKVLVEADTVFVTSDQGVFKSTDNGTNWNQMNTGLVSVDVTSLASSDSVLFAGTRGFRVYMSTDNGSTWTSYSTGIITPYIDGLGLNGNRLFAGTHGRIYYSDLSSGVWTQVPFVTSGSRSFHFDGNSIIAGSDDGVIRSTDYGATWTKIDSIHISNSYSQAWDVLKLGNRIIAGYNNKGIRISTDDGNTWDFSNTGLSQYTTINALASSGNNILAGTNGIGVVLSSDGGATWATSSLDSTFVVAFLEYRHNIFAAGGYKGVFNSIDDGLTWSDATDGLQGYLVNALAISNGYMFAGVSGGGVWMRPLSQIVSVPAKNTLDGPSSFTLAQNFPNPFNPSTTISYRIPFASQTKLQVFDCLGRLVTTLINMQQDPGFHQVVFDASKLPSGIYFYVLQSGPFLRTKAATLIK